jgi:hypothetical protein
MKVCHFYCLKSRYKVGQNNREHKATHQSARTANVVSTRTQIILVATAARTVIYSDNNQHYFLNLINIKMWNVWALCTRVQISSLHNWQEFCTVQRKKEKETGIVLNSCDPLLFECILSHINYQ